MRKVWAYPKGYSERKCLLQQKRKEETSMELLEEILSNENMNNACKQVYRNKGASGIDGIPIEDLAYHLRKNKDEIRNQIRKRKYKPMPALRVEIPRSEERRVGRERRARRR